MEVTQTISELLPPKFTFTEEDLPSLEGKTYLITGEAAGIGREVARMLYSANTTVYIADRSLASIDKATKEIVERPSKGMKMKPTSGEIVPLILDLGNLPTIRPAVQELEKRASKINAVFFNAGIMTPPPGNTTTQGYDLQWGTNVVAQFLFQKVLVPLLLTCAKQTQLRLFGR